MFYFDETINTFEKEYLWDSALSYLEELFEKNPSIEILNSLVGFSWYYLIEGPIDSSKYEKDSSILPLSLWKKYLKIGMSNFNNYASFSFIAGYTILLHGFYIEEYQNNNELIGKNLLLQAVKTTDNQSLKELIETIILMGEQKKYNPLKVSRVTIERIFTNDSLLEIYFKELFGC